MNNVKTNSTNGLLKCFTLGGAKSILGEGKTQVKGKWHGIGRARATSQVARMAIKRIESCTLDRAKNLLLRQATFGTYIAWRGGQKNRCSYLPQRRVSINEARRNSVEVGEEEARIMCEWWRKKPRPKRVVPTYTLRSKFLIDSIAQAKKQITITAIIWGDKSLVKSIVMGKMANLLGGTIK